MTLPIPSHLNYLNPTNTILKTSDGKDIEVWELGNIIDQKELSMWAKHFREQYCLDADINNLIDGTEYNTKTEFLNTIIFPDQSIPPGPSIRAGDFAEILLTDYLEFKLGFWVPRGKYKEKWNRNESIKGVDVLGIKIVDKNKEDPRDILITVEAKAHLSEKKYKDRLQIAIDDSSKDILRRAETLNAIKRRLIDSQQINEANIIRRFQNKADRPYIYQSTAAAVLTTTAFEPSLIESTSSTENHKNVNNLKLIIIKGDELMKFVHALYERAANEA